VVQLREVDWDDEDSGFEVDYSYPVDATPKKKQRATPYPGKRTKPVEQPQPVEIPSQLQDTQMSEPIPRSESQKEQGLRKSKTYRFNAWDAVKNMPVPISLKDLAQMNPAVRQQLRMGLSEEKPGWEIRPVNMTAEQEAAEPGRKTPAYAQCQIEGLIGEAIVDSGSGISLISKIDWTGRSRSPPTSR